MGIGSSGSILIGAQNNAGSQKNAITILRDVLNIDNIQFDGDIHTWRNSAGSLNYMIINSSGNYMREQITIDATNPWLDFSLDGSIETYETRMVRNSTTNGDFDIVNRGTGSFNIYTNMTERLSILGTGNVGIGTSTPAEKLEVYSTVRISGSATNFMNISGRIIRGTDGTNGSGVFFSSNTLMPTNKDGTLTDNGIDLGNGSYRWRVVYAGTGAINTSDKNMKDNIQDLEKAEIEVASELSDMIKTFKFKDAIEEKGDKARIHTGFIAQEVEEVFSKYGLEAMRYGLLCIDNVYKVDGEKVDADGNIYTKDSENVEIEKVYGVRMSELLCFMNAGLNNKYNDLLKRIEALEKKGN